MNKQYLKSAQQYLRDIRVGDWVKLVDHPNFKEKSDKIFQVEGICFFDEGVPVYRVTEYNLYTDVNDYLKHPQENDTIAFWGFELEKIA